MPKGVYKHDLNCLMKNLNIAIKKNTGRKYGEKHRIAISKGVIKSYEGNEKLKAIRRKTLKKIKTPEMYKKMVRTRKKNKSYEVSADQRKKISKGLKGKKSELKSIANRRERNPNWKNGITPLNRRIRYSEMYKIWVKKVFEKDDYTCQDCGKRGGDLEAHHEKEFAVILKENKIKSFIQALGCAELWDVDNGTTLCKVCHKKRKKRKT